MSIKSRLRKFALILAIFLAIVVAVFAVIPRGSHEMPPPAVDLETSRNTVTAIFGATGTVGDGLLKAAMNDPAVEKIPVITRRSTPRIEEGIASGLVTMTTHMDYLDYSSLRGVLAEVDTVFWGLGTSARNVSKPQYEVIHVDFPVAFGKEWIAARQEDELSFHFVSGGGAREDSRMHWAREKARAEQALFELAKGTNLRVISYRPGAVIHSTELAGISDRLVQFFFEPFKLAVRSTTIGQAMLEVSARGSQLGNGTILENRDILMYANGYSARAASP